MQSAVFMTWGLLLVLVASSHTKSSCPQKCICTPSKHDDKMLDVHCESVKELSKFASVEKRTHSIVSIKSTYANITEIGPVFAEYTRLRKLDLSNNRITTMERFPDIPNLTDLNLSENKIIVIGETMLPRKLAHLDISNNLISELPLHLMKLAHLHTIHLNNNPIDCTSCDTLIVRDWLYDNVDRVSEAICETPKSLAGHSWQRAKRSNVCSKHKRSKTSKHTVDVDDIMLGDEPIVSSGDDTDEIPRPLLDTDIVYESSGDDENDLDNFIRVTSTPTTSKPDELTYEVTEGDFVFEGETSEKETNEYSNFTTFEDGSGSGDYEMDFDQNRVSTESSEVWTSTTESTITTTENDEGSGMHMCAGAICDEDLENNNRLDNDMIHHDNTMDNGTAAEEKIIPRIVPAVAAIPITDSPVDTVTEIVVRSDGVLNSTENGINEKFGEVVEESSKTPLGTYIFLGILIAVLICLMGYAIVKNQLGNQKESPIQDAEKAAVEMGDMTKAPLISNDNADPPKVNGTPETIPLCTTTNEQLDGVTEPERLGREVANEMDVAPAKNGTASITPETGRVKIRVTELPDSVPKTPVLVTRTRSNAGDIIITPNEVPSTLLFD